VRYIKTENELFFSLSSLPYIHSTLYLFFAHTTTAAATTTGNNSSSSNKSPAQIRMRRIENFFALEWSFFEGKKLSVDNFSPSPHLFA
jgi:hypothetical protein